MMATKIDFDIPDDLIPDRNATTAVAAKETSESVSITEPVSDTDVIATTKTSSKQKATKAKPSALDDEGPAITVRLAFNKLEYKALLSLALEETEKTGKRCSVTKLIYQHTSKLVKKVNTNA